MAHIISPIDGEMSDLLQKTFTHQYRQGYVTVDGCVMPEYYRKFADRIENFEVRNDDVWVCSFPKTGTTWTQEMVWCIANDAGSEEAKEPLTERFPFIEFSTLFDFSGIAPGNLRNAVPESALDSVGYVDKISSPRFIKSHLPFNLLPRQIRTGDKKPKIIYVARNAKDTCISFFHHCKLIEGFHGDFKDFVNLFVGDKLHYAPFWANILSYWQQRIRDNVLFIKFEDMKVDLPSVIGSTAKFLEKNLTSDEVAMLNDHLRFATMKANPKANNENLVACMQEWFNIKHEGTFIRNGSTGQWKTVMSPEVIERIDSWTHQNLKGTGLSF